MSETRSIYQRLLDVQKAVTYLQKEKHGVGLQYPYVSSSQVLGAIREKMDEAGLILAPEVITARIHFNAVYDTKQHLTELDMRFIWINADDPQDRLECPWYGQGTDHAEKGVGKALTYAEKYFLLKFFHIPTDEDDPDAFQADGEKPTDEGKPSSLLNRQPQNLRNQMVPPKVAAPAPQTMPEAASSKEAKPPAAASAAEPVPEEEDSNPAVLEAYSQRLHELDPKTYPGRLLAMSRAHLQLYKQPCGIPSSMPPEKIIELNRHLLGLINAYEQK